MSYTGAGKTAEQLDAVSSFVAQRNFPEVLGRRIRRHFRHFYSMKSAIDEEKIFKEMSPLLRMEVSSYIVMVQMSDVKIFQTMDPLLWSNLYAWGSKRGTSWVYYYWIALGCFLQLLCAASVTRGGMSGN